jgi:hypothetical protein
MPTEFLNMVVTIAIGLAALASLITLFKDSQRFTNGDVRDFRGLILSCLLICLGALLPLLLIHLVDEAMVWAVCSFAFVVLAALNQLQLSLDIRAGRYVVWSGFSLPARIITILVDLIVLVNVFVWQNKIPYLLGLFWILAATVIRLYIFLISVTNEYSLPDGAREKHPNDAEKPAASS